MFCFICGCGANEKALYRQNEKGTVGIWACIDHNEMTIDPLVKELTDLIEQDNKGKKETNASFN